MPVGGGLGSLITAFERGRLVGVTCSGSAPSAEHANAESPTTSTRRPDDARRPGRSRRRRDPAAMRAARGSGSPLTPSAWAATAKRAPADTTLARRAPRSSRQGRARQSSCRSETRRPSNRTRHGATQRRAPCAPNGRTRCHRQPGRSRHPQRRTARSRSPAATNRPRRSTTANARRNHERPSDARGPRADGLPHPPHRALPDPADHPRHQRLERLKGRRGERKAQQDQHLRQRRWQHGHRR